jgi:hypothetical protein
MIRYKTFDASQGLFLTVNLEEQLIPGSFEHTLNYLIDRLGQGPFCLEPGGGGQAAVCASPDAMFIADKKQEENLCDKMRKKIDESKNRVVYGRRMQIIEPCFSDMSYCKGMNRFSLRTKVKVNIQWLLYCIVHNIGKCIPKVAIESEG